MRKITSFVVGGAIGFLSAVATTFAGTPSPVQSPWRPLNLPIVGQVQLAKSDANCTVFEASKTAWLNMIHSKLPEGVAYTGAGLTTLDPKRLYFFFDYQPRVYFLAEGACYNNALGVTIATVTAPTDQPVKGTDYTIFPNTHSSISNVCSTNSGVRSASEPLLAGDFVDLPTVKAGQQLAFFLMAEMSSKGVPAHTYYNGSTTNPDNFQHLIAFFPDNSNFIIIGFEDMLNGGDKDCNDVLFAVDIGPNNAQVLRQPSLPK